MSMPLVAGSLTSKRGGVLFLICFSCCFENGAARLIWRGRLRKTQNVNVNENEIEKRDKEGKKSSIVCILCKFDKAEGLSYAVGKVSGLGIGYGEAR